MASNRIQGLNPLQLEALSAQILNAVGDAAATYGLSAAQVTALTGTSETLGIANVGVDNARSLYRGAVQARDAAAKATAAAVASVARSIYAKPGMTDALIASAGLAPRSSSKGRIVPSTPVGLVALPQANGDVVLAWSREGNPEGVVFAVEAKVGAGEWAFVANTTRVRLTLEAYATGETTQFRVSASKNETVSAPSAAATIYAPASPVALKIAA